MSPWLRIGSTRSPIADDRLVPWFATLARNATASRGMAECYDISTKALRTALLSGTSVEDPEAVECMLMLTREDAQLFGPLGQLGHNRMSKSIRDLKVKLDTKKVGKYLDKMIDTVEPVAGDVLKAALIAQFGPAAGLALHGKDLALASILDKDDKDDKQKKKQQKQQQQQRKQGRRKPTHEERRQRVRRLSPASLTKQR